MRLLVNIDHIATLRNARGEGVPDPVDAARVCEGNGAEGIVFHLREDRRHIKDDDVYRLSKSIKGVIDFEMAATDEMLEIASKVKPDLSTLVPEKRQELTTEGGLRMPTLFEDFKKRVIPALKKNDIEISLFIDPIAEDIELAAKLEADAVELHTGTYANAKTPEDIQNELKRLKDAADLANSLGLKVNSGHGLNFENIGPFLEQVHHLNEVSIGHALIVDAIFNGLGNSVRRMADIIKKYNQAE